MFTLGILDFGDSIAEAFVSILLLIDSIIYGFIDKLYQIFMSLASARILSEDAIQAFIGRLYIIMGVVMLFVLAYSILVTIINPDSMNKNEAGTGKILKNIVISIVFLALTPAAFNMLYRVQDVVLRENVLGKLILGGISDDSSTAPGISVNVAGTEDTVGASWSTPAETIDNSVGAYEYGGRTLAFELFNPFFTPNVEDTSEITIEYGDYFVNEGVVNATGILCAGSLLVVGVSALVTAGATLTGLGWAIASCAATGVGAIGNAITSVSSQTISYEAALGHIISTGDFGIITAFAGHVVDGSINYVMIISTVVGIFALYVFFSFCLDLGVRAAKLAYFQMIAPIPILFKILPKGGKVFDTWLKKTLSTFAEVFIRIIVIFFVVYLVCNLPAFSGDFWAYSYQIGEPSGAIKLFAKAFILLGLIVFAKQAPKLLSDMFGISGGGIKLGIREKLAESGVMQGYAGIASGLQSGVRNFNAQKGKGFGRRLTSSLAGFGSGAARGFAGAKDAKTFAAAGKAKDEAVRKTEAKRDQRIEKRNYYDNMRDEAGNPMGPVEARFSTYAENVKQWMGIGPSVARYEAMGGLEKAKDEVWSPLKGLFAKYDNPNFFEDMSLAGNNGKNPFKGHNAADAQRMYQEYIVNNKLSFKQAKEALEGLKAQQKAAQEMVAKATTEDERQRYQETSLRLIKDVAAMDSMLAQLEKKTLIRMVNEFNKGNAASVASQFGMKAAEVQDIQSKSRAFIDKYTATDVTLRNDDDVVLNPANPGAMGKFIDEVATAAAADKAETYAQIERQKARQKATKGDSK